MPQAARSPWVRFGRNRAGPDARTAPPAVAPRARAGWSRNGIVAMETRLENPARSTVLGSPVISSPCAMAFQRPLSRQRRAKVITGCVRRLALSLRARGRGGGGEAPGGPRAPLDRSQRRIHPPPHWVVPAAAALVGKSLRRRCQGAAAAGQRGWRRGRGGGCR